MPTSVQHPVNPAEEFFFHRQRSGQATLTQKVGTYTEALPFQLGRWCSFDVFEPCVSESDAGSTGAEGDDRVDCGGDEHHQPYGHHEASLYTRGAPLPPAEDSSSSCPGLTSSAASSSAAASDRGASVDSVAGGGGAAMTAAAVAPHPHEHEPTLQEGAPHAGGGAPAAAEADPPRGARDRAPSLALSSEYTAEESSAAGDDGDSDAGAAPPSARVWQRPLPPGLSARQLRQQGCDPTDPQGASKAAAIVVSDDASSPPQRSPGGMGDASPEQGLTGYTASASPVSVGGCGDASGRPIVVSSDESVCVATGAANPGVRRVSKNRVVCPHCGEDFKKTGLAAHMRWKHADLLETSAAREESASASEGDGDEGKTAAVEVPEAPPVDPVDPAAAAATARKCGICPHCNQRFKPSGLSTHIRLKHPDEYAAAKAVAC